MAVKREKYQRQPPVTPSQRQIDVDFVDRPETRQTPRQRRRAIVDEGRRGSRQIFDLPPDLREDLRKMADELDVSYSHLAAWLLQAGEGVRARQTTIQQNDMEEQNGQT